MGADGGTKSGGATGLAPNCWHSPVGWHLRGAARGEGRTIPCLSIENRDMRPSISRRGAAPLAPPRTQVVPPRMDPVRRLEGQVGKGGVPRKGRVGIPSGRLSVLVPLLRARAVACAAEYPQAHRGRAVIEGVEVAQESPLARRRVEEANPIRIRWTPHRQGRSIAIVEESVYTF